LGLDLSKTYHDRTAIQNFKTAFSFLSLMVPSILMGLCLKNANSANGYLGIAIVTSVLCVVCALICFFGTPKTAQICTKIDPKTPQKGAKKHRFCTNSGTIFDDFFGIIKQKNVGILIAGYAVSLAAGAFLTSLGLHVFTYTFHFSTAQIPIIMVCLIAGIIGGQPLWYYYAKRTDKTNALVTAIGTLLVCMVVFSVILCFRGQISVNMALGYLSVAIFFCGVGTGALYSLPISMFADCIAMHQEQSGIDKTGKSAGFLTFCTKISNAGILFIIGLSLDIIGFNAGGHTQTMNVQNWLGWFLVFGVTVSCAAAMFVYAKYSYTKEDFKS
jgi:Na+/melibiose symporter-like transporter